MVAFDTSNMVDRIAANVQADSWWPPLVGTTERAALALKLIASLRWVDQRAKRDVTQDPAPVRRAFNCLVAFHHFFPQSSNFVATAPYRVDASTEKTQTPLNFCRKARAFRRGLGQTGGHVRRHSRLGAEVRSASQRRGAPGNIG